MKLPVSRSQSGYSLLEIMVAVAMVGILAAIATASFTQWLKKSDFKEQRVALFDILTRARNMANSRNECVVVKIQAQTIKVASHSRGANGDCNPVGAKQFELDDVNFKPGYTIGLFDNTNDTLVFNPYGGAEASSVVSIFMSGNNGSKAGFRIYPALGQIRSVD